MGHCVWLVNAVLGILQGFLARHTLPTQPHFHPLTTLFICTVNEKHSMEPGMLAYAFSPALGRQAHTEASLCSEFQSYKNQINNTKNYPFRSIPHSCTLVPDIEPRAFFVFVFFYFFVFCFGFEMRRHYVGLVFLQHIM